MQGQLRAAADLTSAMRPIQQPAHASSTAPPIPIDRVADQKLYCSGEHRRHRVNMQVIADADGRLVWASPALTGSAHDLTAAGAMASATR